MLGTRTGVGHATAALIDALTAAGQVDVIVYGITFRGRDALAAQVPRGARAATRPVSARLVQHCWRRFDEPRIERWTGPVDLVHGTNFVGPPARAPVLVTVHDLAFVQHPELAVAAHTTHYRALIERALHRGAALHVPSDHVAAQARDVFGLGSDRVTRVYPGIDTTGSGDPIHGRRLAGGDLYLLFLGELNARKNVPRLVQAFDAVAADDPDVRLVLAGPDGPDGATVDAAIARSARADRVRRTGYVSATDRLDLLAGASVFAFPSLDEGFGHPPLEAMHAGVPVVAARAGSLPEVLGDAARFADPADVDDLASAIAAALEPATAHDLVARGRERAARYRWDVAANEMVALYERLAT